MRANALLLLPLGLVAPGATESADREATPPPARSWPAVADRLPELRGVLHDGTAFSLTELRGRPVVLIFYRGSFCGLCRERLRALAAHEAAYDRRDARVLAATPDTPARAEAARDTLDLDFPIVSVGRTGLAAWGVWPAGRTRPLPAAFILDAQGRVRFRHIGRSAADRVSDAVLLAALDRLEADTRGGRR